MLIRLRLTIWYTVVLAATLVAFGAIFYVTLSRVLLGDIDSSLEARADSVTAAIRVRSAGSDLSFFPRRATLPRGDAFASPSFYVQLLDREGMIVERSENLGNVTLPYDPDWLTVNLGPNDEVFQTLSIESQQLRLYMAPIIFNEETVGYLQVARSLELPQRTLSWLRTILLTSGLLIVISAAGIGWLLAGAALRPIDRVTQTARAIAESGQLNQRLKLTGPSDEIGRLVVTFNAMLDRIESVMAAQRRFVADASHQLRTPLTTIRGNIDLLRRSPKLSQADRIGALEDTALEAEHVSRLVDGLLALARADAGRQMERQAIDFSGVIREAVQAARLHAQRAEVVLDSVVADKPLFVSGDRPALRDMATILIDNAIKYNRPGGHVWVELDGRGDLVHLVVRDDGLGIDRDDIGRVFERFYRGASAQNRSGTGLGLAIARWAVHEHGGRIDLTSQADVGTTVGVWLPALTTPDVLRSDAESDREPTPAGGISS